jgi:signal transduction histidine kinase/Flp pilus assembly protein TadD
MMIVKLRTTFSRWGYSSLFILFAILFICSKGFSQTKSNHKNSYSQDTALVNRYLKKAHSFVQSQASHDSARYYLEKILSLSQRRNYAKGITEYYRLKAVVYFIGEKEDSLSLAISKAFASAKTSRDAKELALVNDVRGWIFQNLEQNDSATYYYIQAVKIADSLKDHKFSGEIYSNLAVLFWSIGNYQKAAEYAAGAYHNGTILHDTLLLSNSLFDLGNAKASSKQYDTAILLYKRVKELVKDPVKYNYVLFSAVSNEAGVYADMGNHKKAISAYKKILRWNSVIPAHLQSYVYSGLGAAQYEENQLNEAESNMAKAIKLASEGGVKIGLRDSYLLMSQIKEKQNQFALALDFRKKYDSLNDTLMSSSRTKFIHQLEAKYHSAQKNNQITQQQLSISENQRIIQRKNIINAALISGVLFLLIVGILLYRNFNHRNKLLWQNQKLKEQRITELEQERKLVAAQSVMKGQEAERSRLARDLHDGVGGLLSGVKLSMSNMKGNVFLSEENAQTFENVISQLDQSIAELRRVSHNMMPEALIKYGLKEALENYCENMNFSGKINVQLQTYGMEKRMEQSTEIIIYRMIQELLNNVIKHADARNVLIQLVRKEDHFNLTVEDDGKGIDAKENENKTGAGLANIKARAEYLNGNVDIVSKKGEGTSVNIEGSCS